MHMLDKKILNSYLLPGEVERLVIKVNASNMVQLMADCDLAIGTAGSKSV